MQKYVSCKRWSNCGRRCPTRSASSTRFGDASQSAFEADRKLKTALRKRLQPKVRVVRKFLAKQIPLAPPAEAEQLAVIDDYAAGILTGLNTEGKQPFKYAAAEAAEVTSDVAASLKRLGNMGQP